MTEKMIAVTRYTWDGTSGHLYPTIAAALADPPGWPDPDLVKLYVVAPGTSDARIVFSQVMDKELWT